MAAVVRTPLQQRKHDRYMANCLTVLRRSKAWREANRERYLAYQRAWRAAHPGYAKAWRETNRRKR